MTRTSHMVSAGRMFAALALLASGTIFTACGGADPGSSEDEDALTSAKPAKPAKPTKPSAQPSPAVKVAFAAALPSGAFTPISEASIGASSSVFVVADWTGVTTDQSERMVLTSPEGSVYYAADIGFADGSTSLVSSFALPDGTRRVVFQLLIWGTTIESYADTGTWTASATLVNGAASGTAALVLN